MTPSIVCKLPEAVGPKKLFVLWQTQTKPVVNSKLFHPLAQKNMSEMNFGTFFKLTHFERTVTDKIVMASNTSFAYKYLFRPF